MRIIIFITFFSFSYSAYSITVADLITNYGKKNIMHVIANKLPEGFSAEVNGHLTYSHGPDEKYVNERTLEYDIKRVGMTPNDVQKYIEIEREKIRKKISEEIVLNERHQYEEQKKKRIQEAKMILEEHRKEYLARDMETVNKNAERNRKESPVDSTVYFSDLRSCANRLSGEFGYYVATIEQYKNFSEIRLAKSPGSTVSIRDIVAADEAKGGMLYDKLTLMKNDIKKCAAFFGRLDISDFDGAAIVKDR